MAKKKSRSARPSSTRGRAAPRSTKGRRGRASRVAGGAAAVAVLAALGVLAAQQLGLMDTADSGGVTGATADGDVAPADFRDPPDASSVELAQERLGELTVEEEDDPPGYDRALFPHWDADVQDNCTTRQVVLGRDGENVETDEDCQPVSGSWYSAYDGETLTDPGDVDIDHMVALKEAWRSGTHSWSTEQRQRFANDLDTTQLWAVSASSNRAKGDQDPADWLPPLESSHCAYVVSWIEVKHTWELTLDEAEDSALREVLSAC
ncbi:HNH endonuclease [Spiractinospora alimapuensis]|uniref:HNH endonuclease family protein n=1 Tax=Spiractinospora alimapuensis TaxID=2820884 RepID=UPI001F29ACFB|nr:HNH endonuclease family protein [Spiractinospora alimapuensis]QVQ53348.1 HNH endonuclease [Spiractinospora alimapuensis]